MREDEAENPQDPVADAAGIHACPRRAAGGRAATFAGAAQEAVPLACHLAYNDIPTAAYYSPRLTTIRQDIYQAGRVLVAKLMRILDGEKPKSALIKTELIERDT